LSELIRQIKVLHNEKLLIEIIDALTTNETLFFRDLKPFDILKTSIIPTLIERNKASKAIRIWSAACSTGQEAFSIAMTIRENFPQLNSWNISIIGTDICHEVLTRATEGVYSQAEVNRGLPIKMLVKYFTNDQGRWVVKDDLKKMVKFEYLNFVDKWPPMMAMDIIFIRNVLIYFSHQVKTTILTKMSKQLNKGGYLFLGSSESLIGLDVPFKGEINDNIRYFTTI
jgi:chemotaxis protein methyltransferase CheR